MPTIELEQHKCRDFAEFLSAKGDYADSADMWLHLVRLGYRDQETMQRLGDTLFLAHDDKFPVGTIERSHFLLSLIAQSLPTKLLSDAYFRNLDLLLRHRTVRDQPGQLVLGIGTGRCGSTSLTQMIAAIPDSCATHENPPLIYWRPLQTQIDFHLRRFTHLLTCFGLVFDAAHWWLPVLDHVVARFPDVKVVALHRDTQACLRSFERLKGKETNHWAPTGNGVWAANAWDETYPCYPLPVGTRNNPNDVRRQALRRYIKDYNAALMALPAQMDRSSMLIPTEQLSDPDRQAALFHFLGASGPIAPVQLNADATITDGQDNSLQF